MEQILSRTSAGDVPAEAVFKTSSSNAPVLWTSSKIIQIVGFLPFTYIIGVIYKKLT